MSNQNYRLAQSILEYFLKQKTPLKYWSGTWYTFRKSHYVVLADSDLKAIVMKWLQSYESASYAGQRCRDEVIANLMALSLIPTETKPGSWLSEKTTSGMSICVDNGLLDLDALKSGKLNALHPHDSDFFTLTSIATPFNPSGDCPMWIKFLNEMLPDKADRSMLQQWIGYQLIYDTKFQKFMLYTGQGANGKSVVCVVHRVLLGEDNISAVGLEGFNPARTFPLAATQGKLSNLVEELNEIEKTAEGLLKQFVGGGPVTIERKHRDAFTMIPTARLTFATNVLPRFTDRTSGLWRRLILIAFRQQILDETKQDRRLVDPDYWRASGELPGILNWAIVGLLSLLEKKSFSTSESSAEAKSLYREESNPAGTFLTDFYVARENSEISATVLYQSYRSHIDNLGHRPLSESQFSIEVRRIFPHALKSKHPKRIGGLRARAWTGIFERPSNDTANTADSDFSSFQ
jgi:putative DNA primase/helicase